MEHGRFVEFGKADEVILNPKAAYTKRLISDVPKIHEEWDLSTVELKYISHYRSIAEILALNAVVSSYKEYVLWKLKHWFPK